jgi:hypothetical protein
LAGFRDGFICRLVKENEISQEYVRECFDGREIEFSFFCLAFLTGDYRICNNNEGQMFYRCLAFLEHDADFCGMGKISEFNDICYSEMAASARDKSLCGNIKDLKLGSDCRAMLPEKEEYPKEDSSI